MNPRRKPIVRFKYTKVGKIRFTSHRDMARIFERAVRKAGMPVAYSEGFSPRAKLSFGLALPTVFESQAEYCDITLEHIPEKYAQYGENGQLVVAEGVLERELSELLPIGVDITDSKWITYKVESLQECVYATEWELFVSGDRTEISTWLQTLIEAEELLLSRTRKGRERTDDVRPALLSAQTTGNVQEVARATENLKVLLAAKPRALRPLELLSINNPPFEFVLGRRTNQFISPIGARRDPIALGAAENKPKPKPIELETEPLDDSKNDVSSA